MKQTRFSIAVLGIVLAIGLPPMAEGSLCRGKYIHNIHRSEALELEAAPFSNGSDCSSDNGHCFIGERSLNEMILACNRKRDYTVAGTQLPPRGAILDQRSAEERNFPADLPQRAITGEYNFLGLFLKRYGYLLERQGGQWIVTSILDFQFPNAEPDKLHIPLLLAGLLSESEIGGRTLSDTICHDHAADKHSNGIVLDKNGNDRACRVDRNSSFYLYRPPLQLGVGPRSRNPDAKWPETKEWRPLPLTLATGPRPITEWLMLYWRGYIERYWSRPDGSFRMKVEIANLAGRPGEISTDDLATFRRMGVVYPVELHHHEQRLNNMYRPIKVAGVKIYKAIYAGEKFPGFIHEFGHSLGLGDDYASRDKPPNHRNCDVLSGMHNLQDDTLDHQKDYVMCDGGGQRQHIKSVYLWIATQRYPFIPVAQTSDAPSLRQKVFCLSGGDCPEGQYCEKGITNRCMPYKAIGENCATDAACLQPAQCIGKPRGRCLLPGSRSVDQSCMRNGECMSGRCTNSVCVCKADTDCSAAYGNDYRCSIQALKVNKCVKVCENDSGCGLGKCVKPVGTAFGRCKK